MKLWIVIDSTDRDLYSIIRAETSTSALYLAQHGDEAYELSADGPEGEVVWMPDGPIRLWTRDEYEGKIEAIALSKNRKTPRFDPPVVIMSEDVSKYGADVASQLATRRTYWSDMHLHIKDYPEVSILDEDVERYGLFPAEQMAKERVGL